MRSLFRTGSRLSALIFASVGLWFAVQMDYARLPDNIVPLLCIGLAFAVALWELAHRDGDIDWTVTGGLGLSLFTLFLILIRTIGFLPATPLFVMAIFFAISKNKARALLIGAVFGALLAASIHVLFVIGMGNLLPMGMFE